MTLFLKAEGRITAAPCGLSLAGVLMADPSGHFRAPSAQMYKKKERLRYRRRIFWLLAGCPDLWQNPTICYISRAVKYAANLCKYPDLI